MLFGNPQDFAIEAMVEPTLRPPSSVWGRMRVWCEGHSLGDYAEEHCALYGSYKAFEALAAILPGLWSNDFNSLSDSDLYDYLDGLLYGYRGDVELDDLRSLKECQRDGRAYGKYIFLTNWGEQFDAAPKAFVVCPTGLTAKILTRTSPPESRLSLSAPVESVQRAISAFGQWFESEAQRLSVED